MAPVFASGTDVAWTYTNAAYFTVKAARSVADGTTALLLYAEEQSATLVALKASGDVLWGPTDYGSKHGEGTDMVVAQDGTGFAISGHGSGGVVGSGGPDPLYGRLTLVGPTGAYVPTARALVISKIVCGPCKAWRGVGLCCVRSPRMRGNPTRGSRTAPTCVPTRCAHPCRRVHCRC